MVTVYFVTNRRPNRKSNPTDFTGRFSDDGPANLRFGVATASGEKLDRISVDIAPERLVVDEARKTLAAGSRVASTGLMTRIRDKMRKHGRATVIFIHGYNVAFREAVTAAARMKRNFKPVGGGKGVNVVLFSWPSDGRMTPFLAYASDRQDAAASGPAMARAFLKLADFLQSATHADECAENMHLVAHSMGNYVLRHAVQEVSRQYPGRLPRVFDQVFMMAADEDDDTFEHDYKLLFLPRLCQRVNVYFNNGDNAMLISDKTKGHPDRLGDDGPRVPRSVPGKVTSIDATPVVEGVVEHSYFVDSPRVVQDMIHVLDGLSPNAVPGRQYIHDTNRFRLKPDAV